MCSQAISHLCCKLRCSAAPSTLAYSRHVAPRWLAESLVDPASCVPVEPFEYTTLGVEPCDSTASAVEARLVSPSTSEFSLTHVPTRVHADRPFEVNLTAIRLGVGDGPTVARLLSAHARLAISVEGPGQPRGEVSLPVVARPSGCGWIARALIRPAFWADAASVTVLSFSLAGRPLSCDCLPVTLQVGYNHAPAQEGAVAAAAKAGDVPALQAALDAGGSTEEANEVRQD